MGFCSQSQTGGQVVTGDIIGMVQETPVVEHRIMVPVGIEGTVEWIHQGHGHYCPAHCQGKKTPWQVVEIPMMQRTPVRIGRKV